MKFLFSIFEISHADDGHFEMQALTIGWGERFGSLFGLAICPNCGISFDLFWIGLAIEPTE